ncbi:MAG: hypothetical protein DME94_05415 [Verrucomicrobia bacterium]|nr:MAG: hypothetical protein DME94_05415 [Verrucomicrobiota bacterium]
MAAITQAFVLAAGVGKRLRPLTDDLPKPLIPIFQKPLITFALDHLSGVGVDKYVINTHRRPELFQSFFNRSDYAGQSVTLVHEPELLETGGGIKNAERYFGSDPFITYSGDILTDVNLQPLIEEHFRRGNDVTLALRDTGYRCLEFSGFSANSAAEKDFFYSDSLGLDGTGRQDRRLGDERRKMVQYWFARRIPRGAPHDSARRLEAALR